MGFLCTPPPSLDPLTTVIGVGGTPYPCPDIAALDGHIAWSGHRIEHAAARFSRLEAEFLADIDLLLDRRHWLEIEQQTPFRDAA